MTKLQEALADAKTHTTKGTLLSDEAIDRICTELIALAEPKAIAARAVEPCMQCGRSLTSIDHVFGGFCADCDDKHHNECDASKPCDGCRDFPEQPDHEAKAKHREHARPTAPGGPSLRVQAHAGSPEVIE